MIEIGGKNNSEVLTEMQYKEGILDACNEHTDYLVHHEPNSTKFTWKKFKSQMFKVVSPSREIPQLCDPYKISWLKECGMFVFAKNDYCSFKVPLPQELKHV